MSGWRQTRTSTQKFPRQATRVPIRIATVDPELDPDTGEPFFRATEATTANLSRGGVFVHSWEPLASGRRVLVALDLPAGGELELLGRVVWTRRQLTAQGGGPVDVPGYGIEFVSLTRAEQAAIQQILDASASDEASAPTVVVAPSAAAATAPSATEAAAATSAAPAAPTAAAAAAAAPKVRPAFPPVA